MICRVRDNESFNKLFGEGTSSSAASEIPPHKCTNLNPGYSQPAAEEDLPRPSAITSSRSVSCLSSFLFIFLCQCSCFLESVRLLLLPSPFGE